MRRRNLFNGVLLAAALTLGLLGWLLPARDSGSGSPLTSLVPGEVDALEIELPADDRPALALERRRDGWHLIRPIERAARDGRIVTALGILGARTESCYGLDDRDPREFGLARPRMILRVGEVTVAFGDRAPDGRRYVRSGGRLCLVRDRSYPLLAQGLDGLAAPALLRAGAVPLRIETPRAAAARPNSAAEWSLQRGGGNAQARDLEGWAARWQGARAKSFLLDPPEADHGRVRIETEDGTVHQWRIARPPPDLVLVPTDATYGMSIPAARGGALLQPPAGPRSADSGAGTAEDSHEMSTK